MLIVTCRGVLPTAIAGVTPIPQRVDVGRISRVVAGAVHVGG